MYNYFMKYFRKRAIHIGMKLGVNFLPGKANPTDSPWGAPARHLPNCHGIKIAHMVVYQ